MEIYGVRIPTVIEENNAARCAGCGGVIEGFPWRINVLDAIAPEVPVDWTETAAINPGPFEFHRDPACAVRWMGKRGYFFCRRSEVREQMRPVWLPLEPKRLGLCDGVHRDDHEFVDAAALAAELS